MQAPIWFARICAFSCLIPTLFAQAGPPGARVNRLLTFASQPEVVVAATSAGVFRSSDGGRTWAVRSAGLPALNVTSVAGPSWRLYAGLEGGGLWRSVNGGVWEQADAGIGDANITDVAVDPNNPRIVYAGTANDGAFFSNNGADGWIRPGSGLPEIPFVDFEFSPGDSQHIFAAGAGGLFESLDGGQTWADQVTGTTVFRRIRFDPNEPETVYVATTNGLIRRNAGEDTFALVAAFRAQNTTDIVVDPLNSDVLYAASIDIGLLRSVDRGATWAIGGTGLPRAVLLSLQTMPDGPAESEFSRLIAGANGSGVFESIDGAASWSLSAAGMRGANVNVVAVDPSDGQKLYAATDGGGLFKSIDGGRSWSEARSNLQHQEPSVLEIDPANPNTLYVGSVNPNDRSSGAMSRSTDGAALWQPLLSGRPIFDIAVHPSDGRTVWLGTDSGFFGNQPGLNLSRDGGATLSRSFLFGLQVSSIALDPNDPRNVFAIGVGTFGDYNFTRSDNEGDSFRLSFSTATPLLDIVVDPSNSRRLFVPTFGVGLLRSNDGGRENFEQINQGLADSDGVIDVFSVAVDPSGPARLLIAADTGVYRSDNSGNAWRPANSGLENVVVRQVAIGLGGEAYAASADAGVWVSRDMGESWSPTGRAPLERAGLTHAASFRSGAVAAEQIASLFGGPFTDRVEAASAIPLPTTLAGVSLSVTDSAGTTRAAPLFFAAPGQINFQVPTGSALGTATLRVERAAGDALSVEIEIVRTAPGLFAAAGTGEGPAAANSQLFAGGAGGPATPVFRVADGGLELEPLGLGAEGDQLVLLLFGSGVRNFSGSIQAHIGGVEVPVLGVAAQPQFVGLDQINILVPRSLLGAGVVEVRLTVDGVPTNVVTVRIG